MFEHVLAATKLHFTEGGHLITPGSLLVEPPWRGKQSTKVSHTVDCRNGIYTTANMNHDSSSRPLKATAGPNDQTVCPSANQKQR